MDEMKSNGAKTHPVLIAAFFCEKALIEKDEVMSAIRIVDLVQVQPIPKKIKNKVILTNLVFVLMLRGAGFRGKATWEVHMVSPSGKRIKAVSPQEIEFRDPDKGFNFVLPAAFKWDKPGTYWFEVFVNKRRMTRSPLVIKMLPENPKDQEKKTKD